MVHIGTGHILLTPLLMKSAPTAFFESKIDSAEKKWYWKGSATECADMLFCWNIVWHNKVKYNIIVILEQMVSLH